MINDLMRTVQETLSVKGYDDQIALNSCETQWMAMACNEGPVLMPEIPGRFETPWLRTPDEALLELARIVNAAGPAGA